MVTALGPGRFYGSSLPRPRFYSDVRFNSERVDPPVGVLDPLLEWATDAHWTMGGLSFKRQRLQGKIEGSIIKLRAEKEKKERNKNRKINNGFFTPPLRLNPALLDEDSLPPPVEERKRPIVSVVGTLGRKMRARKLEEEFEEIAKSDEASGSTVSSKKKRRVTEKRIDESVSGENDRSAVASRTRSRRAGGEGTPGINETF